MAGIAIGTAAFHARGSLSNAATVAAGFRPAIFVAAPSPTSSSTQACVEDEVVGLDLDQLIPATPAELRQVKKAKLTGVRGKGRTSRMVFLGRDARHAVADTSSTNGLATPTTATYASTPSHPTTSPPATSKTSDPAESPQSRSRGAWEPYLAPGRGYRIPGRITVQPGIAHWGGPMPAGEDRVLRI